MSKKSYFVCGDVHGFYDELLRALEEKGFDKDNPDHVLICLGDLFDRGEKPIEVYNFVKSLPADRFVYIRGNHEDLLFDCYNDNLISPRDISYHHLANGTYATMREFLTKGIIREVLQFITDRSVYHYEIGDNIFVHGWIPRSFERGEPTSESEWKEATWFNGMQAWDKEWCIKGKTIFCGHWHTSFGNCYYHGIGSGEFTSDACFEPFVDTGIVALDSCVARSGFVNCYRIDE